MDLQLQRNLSSYPKRSSSDNRLPRDRHRQHSRNSQSTLERDVWWIFPRPTRFCNGDLPHETPGPFPNCQAGWPSRLARFICCEYQNLYARDLATGSRLGRWASNWTVPQVEQLSPELFGNKSGPNSKVIFLPSRVPRRASRILWRFAKSIRSWDLCARRDGAYDDGALAYGQNACGASQNGITF